MSPVAATRCRRPTRHGRWPARWAAHLRLLSAVAHWGWETKWPARFPQVVAPRRPATPVRAEMAYAVLPPRDRDGWATSRLRTVLDCAAELPFDEALAVADSALRHGDLFHDDLLASLRPDTPERVRRVLEHATPLAANPFESVLRAILVEAGIDVVPQWATTIGGVTYHPDLADPIRALAVEANGGLPRRQAGARRRLRALQRTRHRRLDRPALHLGAGDVLAGRGRADRASSHGPASRRLRGPVLEATGTLTGVS